VTTAPSTARRTHQAAHFARRCELCVLHIEAKSLAECRVQFQEHVVFDVRKDVFFIACRLKTLFFICLSDCLLFSTTLYVRCKYIEREREREIYLANHVNAAPTFSRYISLYRMFDVRKDVFFTACRKTYLFVRLRIGRCTCIDCADAVQVAAPEAEAHASLSKMCSCF